MSFVLDLAKDAFRKADHLLLALCIIASGYGIILIYSATRYVPGLHSCPMKQAVFACAGIVGYFILGQFNIDVFRIKWKWVMAGCTTLVLLLLTPLGKTVLGNRAWLRIPVRGLDSVTLQPAEVNKIFFAILLAHLLVYLKRNRSLNHISSIVIMSSLLVYFVGLLFVISRDLGSCLIFVAIFIAMVWASGVSTVWFAAGLTAVSVVGYFGYNLLKDEEVHKARIKVLFEKDPNPQGVAFQQIRAITAIRSGGLTGQGFLKGLITQSKTKSKLPERYSDFIFASCCEEWGLIGAAFIVIILTAIILRIIYIGITAPDRFSSLVCFGFAGMFMAQCGLNIGMCLFVMPVIGITLPFFSYGGTSVFVNFLIMGFISGIRNRNTPEWIRNTEQPEIPTPPPVRQPQRKSVLFTPESRRAARAKEKYKNL